MRLEIDALPAHQKIYVLGEFKKALLWNPQGMIRVTNFSAMIRVSDQKLELQVKSRSCSTKSQSYSRGDPHNPNPIAQKRNPNGV